MLFCHGTKTPLPLQVRICLLGTLGLSFYHYHVILIKMNRFEIGEISVLIHPPLESISL